jgi:ubiquinone/menaquinone biosynthesis C-methylase UbiE
MDRFRQALISRSATNYAAFLLPHLTEGMRLLDCGCGIGSITVGLVDRVRPGLVVGADRSFGEFRSAIQHASEHNVSDLEFIGADAFALPFRNDTFDAALAHSMLETLERPSEALGEIRRVLKPGGVVGVASVEYGGLLLAGPSVDLLERFYEIRQQLWLRTGIAVPRTGRHLRGFLVDAGFSRIEASARYIAYGNPETVKEFGLARARDCEEPEFAGPVVAQGLADSTTLQAMAEAWSRWAQDSRSFAAFAWGNALAWK